MDVTKHIRRYFDIYLIILSWVIAGRFAPNVVAVGWSVISYMFILKSNNLTKVLLAFLMMLVLSDSRVQMMGFAATAKIGFSVVTALFVIRSMKDYKDVRNQVIRYIAPFLIFAVIASLWNVNPVNAFQKSISYSLVYFSVPFLFLFVREQNERIGTDLICFFTIVLGVGLLSYVISPDFAALVGRFRGLLGNPNGLGILLTVLAPLYYLFRLKQKTPLLDRYSEILFIGTYILSLVLTGSRTSLFAVLLFIFFIRIRYLTNSFTLLVFLIVVFGYDFLLSSLPQIAQFLGIQEYLRIETLDEGSGRFVAWSFAWIQIQNVFFVGGGFGYTEYIYKVHFWELSALGHQGNAHNSYLTMWLDTGLVGLTLFIVAILRSILAGMKNSRYALPVIYSLLFSANFESWLAASLNPFTSLFIIIVTLLISDSQKLVTESSGETEPTEQALEVR